MPIRPELKALHERSIKNEEEILRYKSCCCFDCTNFFVSTEIIEWLDEGDQKTAKCPHCGFDTVLPNDPNNPISEELLKEMQAAYFGDGGSNDATVYPDFVSLMKAWEQSK